MYVIKLSSKGQLVLPASLRQAHRWRTGDEFVLEEVAGGVLLRPRKPFPATRLDEVAGSLQFDGFPRSVEEMDAAIAAAVCEHEDIADR
ncbi:MAG: AbrB/MazE/SpoVT family DNA-binding domain-containing protein [Defluviicoccus sp.]|nr:MAG: AbrB/MazE/SpoVT family DNA-binding domain-containing protein [Defluviicoccus sp.]